MGHKVIVQVQGEAYLVYGTSCATPMWAGIITTINAARQASS
jgi:subtilase family serine protease